MKIDIKGFIQQSKYILNVSYKPSSTEFKRITEIVLLGIFILGIAAFIISIIIGIIAP